MTKGLDHKLKLKNLLAMITNGDFFSRDSQFEKLSPIYDVTPTEIQEYIKAQLQSGLKEYFGVKFVPVC